MTRYLSAAAGLVLFAALAFTAVASATGSGDLSVPLSQMFTNSCNGETGTLAGTVHITMNETDSHVTTVTNWQDVEGVAISGTIYRATEMTKTYIADRPRGSDFTIILQDERNLISEDKSSNMLVHEQIEITFPSGTVVMKGPGVSCSGPTP